MASSNAGGWGFLIFVGLAAIVVSWLVDAAWLTKFRYGGSYHINSVAHRPRDCDFFGAPIGRKDCHYKAVVTPDSSPAARGAPTTSADITWEKVPD